VVDSLLRLSYTAADTVAATAAFRAVLGTGEVSAAGSRFAWEQVSLVDDGITVSSIKCTGSSVTLRVDTTPELLVVSVRNGSVALEQSGQRLELERHRLALVPLGSTAELRWDRAHLELFSIPPAPLARLLGVPGSAMRVHAPRFEPRSVSLADHFRHTAHLLTTRVFASPEVYARDLVRSQAIDALAAVTVEAFELSNRSEDRTDRDTTALQRALAHMRAHLVEPISIPEVANAAGVSVRGLQVLFQRHLGVSPLMHLRRLRLEAARARLLSQAEEGTTVAEVARQLGYSNSGRFSTHYRDEYGESPAVTLQRVRERHEPLPRADAEAASVAASEATDQG
jgi:AraC-like DNA-binding protein